MERPPGRRRDLALRNWKWLLLLIIVVCLGINAIPSLSTYRVLVDERSIKNATASHNPQRQSMPSYNNLSEEVETVSSSSESDQSRLKYSNGMKNRTDNNVTTLHDRLNQTSPKDDIKVITSAQSKYNATLPGDSNHNTTTYHSSQNQSALASNKIISSRTEVLQNTSTMEYNNTITLQNHHQSSSSTAASYNYSTDIDLVSLTIRDDFFILFNNSALTSWIQHIQNIRSITFIGPPKDYRLFHQNMKDHYPQLLSNLNNRSIPPIRWVNETHWKTTYKNKYSCPYKGACQQLIKLHVFDLRTHLGYDYIGDNLLLVDSDTVWSRNTTFVHTDGRVQYFQVRGTFGPLCAGMDPVKFTEAITMGSTRVGPRQPTLTPYKACQRPEYPNATGGRHIVHHMLFQYDVMMHLHKVIRERWGVSTLWEAFNSCHGHTFCTSRIAEYELYYAFVSEQYTERVRLEPLRNGENYMASSAICDAKEMACCQEKGVLLKGCHDHRINSWRNDPT
eukprot:CAMPEP_0172323458 /NCGR_PEP_ID=MMETSP1058-20130122/48775_1 /TAXON_ID=83371 /ORGANISM="Detonula confervacea, Strain CCMP 353" /LENGTH=505 /DNA_ID=CAMNT_0013039455 /DNA_START=21 /DNA_END=1535 /DNA_ORIENTATION=+